MPEAATAEVTQFQAGPETFIRAEGGVMWDLDPARHGGHDRMRQSIFEREFLAHYKNYRTDRRVWASWGDYDRVQFERACKSKGLKYPFGRTHLNVKTLFALHHALKSEPGMDRALDLLKLELEGTHHRGIDDAKNIAKLLLTLLPEHWRKKQIK